MIRAEELRFPYPFVVSQIIDDDGNVEWEAEAIDLPGCVAGADTMDELLQLMADAQADWIDTAKERGMPLPEPSVAPQYTGKITLRMSPALHRRLSFASKIHKMSLNSFITNQLTYNLGWDSGHRHVHININDLTPGRRITDSTRFESVGIGAGVLPLYREALTRGGR